MWAAAVTIALVLEWNAKRSGMKPQSCGQFGMKPQSCGQFNMKPQSCGQFSTTPRSCDYSGAVPQAKLPSHDRHGHL